MARYRLSELARLDVAEILATSAELWGLDARRRYTIALATAMRKVAAEPKGPTTRERSDLLRGIRSFHIRYARSTEASERVNRPVHILYYRVIGPGLIEIVRVLHDRMDPARHLPD
jgi:toxin ParE1/3/4